jgi:hypothetical protein
MWPWRKPEAEPPAPPPVAAHDDVVRAPRADWRLVGPIQRVISEPPLINPVQRFSGSLAAWQDPSFLAPLAHVVAAEEPSGLIPQIATPVPAADLPLATPPAAPTSARPVQRLASIAGPAPSTVDTATASAADRPPTSVFRSAPVVQRAQDSGPTGRIEMPTALTLHAVPAPAAAPAPVVQRHADHDHEAEPDVPTVAQRTADEMTVSRHADEAPPDEVAQTSADPVYAQLLSADPPSTLPPSTPSAEPAPSTPSGTDDLPVATPPASTPSRRLGLGEPLVGGVPIQRTVAPTPTPAPATSLPLAPTGRSGIAEIRVPPPASPEPVEAPTLGALPPAHPVPGTEVVTIGSGPLPLLPVQRTLDTSSPSTGPLAPTVGSEASDHDTYADHPGQGHPSAPPAAPAPPLTLVGLVGSTPPLLAPPATEAPAHPAAPPVQAVQRLEVGQAPNRVAAGAPVARTTVQLVSEARTPAALTYAAPDGAAHRAATAQPSGSYLSSLPIATASWVNPSIQRTEAAPPAAPITVSRAVEVPEMTVETPAGGDPAPASGGGAGAAPGGGGDPAAMVAHLFDPLLARLKTELRLDRERRGSLTDLWH